MLLSKNFKEANSELREETCMKTLATEYLQTFNHEGGVTIEAYLACRLILLDKTLVCDQ